MAMIIKNRARKALTMGLVNTAVHPYGVGGIEGYEVCVELEVRGIKIIMTDTEWTEATNEIQILKESKS